ncbi:hypothetical protein LR48_Vigan01g080400 [Vigna angularis]|uniref:Uncharacterized protein n=1 Tax=Phaseolus angularis TaxID=3914 RepID=A0A0L9TM59_PHAAN|nr:hypothetical protein LR48_Vigan01g080400 [Vigna angularis]
MSRNPKGYDLIYYNYLPPILTIIPVRIVTLQPSGSNSSPPFVRLCFPLPPIVRQNSSPPSTVRLVSPYLLPFGSISSPPSIVRLASLCLLLFDFPASYRSAPLPSTVRLPCLLSYHPISYHYTPLQNNLVPKVGTGELDLMAILQFRVFVSSLPFGYVSPRPFGSGCPLMFGSGYPLLFGSGSPLPFSSGNPHMIRQFLGYFLIPQRSLDDPIVPSVMPFSPLYRIQQIGPIVM